MLDALAVRFGIRWDAPTDDLVACPLAGALSDRTTQRFGLVHLDTETLVRAPKSSYRWFRAIQEARGR